MAFGGSPDTAEASVLLEGRLIYTVGSIEYKPSSCFLSLSEPSPFHPSETGQLTCELEKHTYTHIHCCVVYLGLKERAGSICTIPPEEASTHTHTHTSSVLPEALSNILQQFTILLTCVCVSVHVCICLWADEWFLVWIVKFHIVPNEILQKEDKY